MIRHNVGTDISKFFFGGYCLEDNHLKGVQGHNHSNHARMIVNDLTVARFEGDVPCSTEEVKVVKSTDVATDTKNFVLKAKNINPAFRSFYEDFRTIGKHFRVE